MASVNFSLSKDWVAYSIINLLENSADEITPRAVALATPIFAFSDAVVHLLSALYKIGQVSLTYFGCLEIAPEVTDEVLDHLKQAVWFTGLAIIGAPLGFLYPHFFKEYFSLDNNDEIDKQLWDAKEFAERYKNEFLYRQKLEKLLAPHFIPKLANLVTSYLPRADVFGRDAWQIYFGVDIEIEPPLPKEMDQILQSPSQLDPTQPNRTVAEDFMLVLIPKEYSRIVEGKKITLPLSLNNLGNLVQHLPNQNPVKYNCFWPDIQKQHGNIPADDSYWVLMSKDVLPGSRNTPYASQKAQISVFGAKTRIPYEVPTLLETATCIFAEYARTGTRLYSDDPITYTYCQESTEMFRLIVGSFGPNGLDVLEVDAFGGYLGVAALWKIPKALGN